MNKRARRRLAELSKENQALRAEIDKQKQAEKTPQNNELFPGTILDSIQDGISVLDTELNILRVNKHMRNLYAHQEPLEGRKCYSVYLNRSTPCEECPVIRALKTRKMEMGVVPLMQGERITGTLELYAYPMFDPSGNPTGVVEYIRDITERKAAESRQQLAAGVLRLLNEVNHEVDTVRKILYLIQDFGGYCAAGIRLKKGEDYPYYETHGFSDDFLKAEQNLCERDSDGTLLRDPSGAPILACMCGNIIRERIDPSLPFFTEGGSFWTNSTTDLLASTTEEERQAHTRNRCHAEGFESVVLIPLKSQGEVIGLLQLTDRRRNRFKLEDIQFFEKIGDSIGIALERKRAEEKIKASLKEKEVLLREIHHRVKNNLAIISSLLNMQKRKVSDSHVLAALQESQNRVLAMSAIHETLYQSENLAAVDMESYVKGVIGNLQNALNGYSGRTSIDLDINDISLEVSQAVPCGLIINELVTNAFKHAFTGRTDGVILITAHDAGHRKIELRVKDNGIGFPKDLDWKKSPSLGLRLISLMVEQLKGSWELRSDQGAEITIRWSLKSQ